MPCCGTSTVVERSPDGSQTLIVWVPGVTLPMRKWPLGPIIARAVRKNPDERYPTAAEMLADVERVGERLGKDVVPPTDRMPTAVVAYLFAPAAWLESRFTGQTVFLTVPSQKEGQTCELIYSAGPLVEFRK